ncbi:HD domain-containing protein [Sphingomonas canadensis]|uniref:HD domain-containing protein n=1 Tax=Sphingomonas canadensis TaxID=1219257 RepID=A0ABW3HB29_9SPHN|nr:HD domain-containing protein [Sphingomonas canadensis]MCW3837607.1 HD domain-containing protein [Sphingomonas canadensis]
MDRLQELHHKADALEEQMSRQLDALAVKSIIYVSGDVDPVRERPVPDNPEGRPFLMGPDPRLQPMPAKPTLIDYFRYRFGPSAHLLQSARLALRAGHDEKIVLACLLHDISVLGFIRADHGFWGAQLIEPYVDPEVAWAVRQHQVVRFYPDESVGYEYPEAYVRFFGADYRPDPHIDRAYQAARNHKWYMSARLVTINDLYSFDPDVVVELDEFTDIIGRNFRQPEEGLGFDDSPSAHMWRTIMMPTRFL